METTIEWDIAGTDYEVATGRILRVHYTVNSTDGEYSYYSCGTVSLNGGLVIPMEALTEELLISWVFGGLGEAEVATIVGTHEDKIAQQRLFAKKVGFGLPWE